MPLRARVGRHANTGAHCQNWKDDQQTVIALLNRVPIADGGAEGMLKAPISAGLAGQELFTAILYFQKKHFSGTPSGFVDPGGPVLAKLESLGSRPAPPPPKDGQWDNMKSGSVERALRKALAGDLRIEHAEVVDIIHATLSNGLVSTDELADLSTIAATSRSISPRSKALLENFVSQVNFTKVGKGPFKLPTEKHRFAAEIVCDFLKRFGKTWFPKLHRDKIGVGLLMRIANPGILDQDQASLCGPAALLHGLATDRPGEYARFAMDLFEEGKAKIGRLFIKPGQDVRSYVPGSSISHVDWLTMASIRDSENWFLDYDTTEKEVAGITMPGELHNWFRLAGYSDIKNETNLTNLTHKGAGTVDDANELFEKGYRVCLFISFNMLTEDKQSWRGDFTTKHWVVQRSKIDLSNGKEIVRVFTWGQGDRKVPIGSKELSEDEFLGNFYGYVAAKA